jgi:hypothetical protein
MAEDAPTENFEPQRALRESLRTVYVSGRARPAVQRSRA